MNILNKFSLFFNSSNNLPSTWSVAPLIGSKTNANKIFLNQDNLKPLNINKVDKVTTENLGLNLQTVPPADKDIVIDISPKTPLSPKNEQSQKLISKINRIFWIVLGCWTTYNLIDAGLARFLALETLTHGTGPLGYVGISLNGADPNFGGGNTGSSVGGGGQNHIRNSKNYFHVFKDSALSDFCDEIFSSALSYTCSTFGNEVFPRYHAILSGMANFGYSREHNTGNVISATLGAISGFLTPTLKFRFTPEEILNCTDSCLFENDPDYGKAAYRTSKPISASRLGIIGSLSQGVNADMLNRMYADPGKVLLGVALLSTAALVARKTYQYYIESASEKQLKPTQVSLSSEKTSYFQSIREKIKPIAANLGWTGLALTLITLNTL